MVITNQEDPSPSQWPEAAQTLLALMHAQGEVARLSEREQLFSTLLVSVNAVLWAFNWETRQVLYVSPAYERIFGRSAACCWPTTTSGVTASTPTTWNTPSAAWRTCWKKARRRPRIPDHCRRRPSALAQRQVLHQPQAEPGQPVIIVGIAEDITDKKQMETELQRLATTDVLTQSSNRRHFFECAIRFEIARNKGRRWPSCCWTSMTSKSSTTLTATRKATTCCSVSPRAVEQRCAVAICSGALAVRSSRRCSGLHAGHGPASGRTTAEEIQRLSFKHDGQTFGITVSQGLTSLVAGDESVDSLFARADAAMYQAKRRARTG
jgi:GGDEF domain-containing protein